MTSLHLEYCISPPQQDVSEPDTEQRRVINRFRGTEAAQYQETDTAH